MYAFVSPKTGGHDEKGIVSASIDKMPFTKDVCFRIRYDDGTSIGYWFTESEWSLIERGVTLTN